MSTNTNTLEDLKKKVNVEIVTQEEYLARTDIDQAISDINGQLTILSSDADKMDYLVAAASGLLCGLLDILWVGEFSLSEGREISNEKAQEFVKKTAKMLGCDKDDLQSCIKFLEEKFPIPADGNTPEFGGGLQHHLRDFEHHPTIVGLFFSLLTQFTGMSYGTDKYGEFIVVPVLQNSQIFIGKTVPDKIFRGTIIWFFHLVSDFAGSNATAKLSGGTGIPGPILSLAKELSAIPPFNEFKVEDKSLASFLSSLFNGTAFASRDKDGHIIKESIVKMDFRGEMGIAIEMGKQAIPVIANDCIVRAFYFIRRLVEEIRSGEAISFSNISNINWNRVKPFGNPTITRMLAVSTAVFTGIDVVDAVVTQKYVVAINYVGIGRFAIALGNEMVNDLKVADVKSIRRMYENIKLNTFSNTDADMYAKIGDSMSSEKLALTKDQIEILYNIEYFKTINDVNLPVHLKIGEKTRKLKTEWLVEWKKYMELGYSDFVGEEDAKLNWYSKYELIERIKSMKPEGIWFRLVLLEAMAFEPYYPLAFEKDKAGKEKPSKKYLLLQTPGNSFNKSEGDKFLDRFVSDGLCEAGYVKRLRNCYDDVLRELNEVLKSALTSLAIAAGVAIAIAVTAGMLAPEIAVAIVGTKFAGLSGAALTSACLAYFGGGAVAVGGLGMAGGTMFIVGGGALLGIGAGTGVGKIVMKTCVMNKQATILQSAKLLVAVREIFLNDEKDMDYANEVYEEYVKSIENIEKNLVELRLKENVASLEEKKKLKLEIKNSEESVKVMMIAMKSMNRFNSSFAEGMKAQ